MSKADTASLLKLVEEAAREGDLEKVRKLIAVADVIEEQAGRRPMATAAAVPSVQPVATATPSASARSRRLPLLGIAMGYAAYNSLATAHAYRIASAEADAALAKSGSDSAEVTLKMRSLSTTAEVRIAESKDGTNDKSTNSDDTSISAASKSSAPTRQQFVLPHVYVSDAVLGRSSWFLTCKKRVSAGGTQTEYSSKSESGAPGISIDIGSSEPRRGQ